MSEPRTATEVRNTVYPPHPVIEDYKMMIDNFLKQSHSTLMSWDQIEQKVIIKYPTSDEFIESKKQFLKKLAQSLRKTIQAKDLSIPYDKPLKAQVMI